MTIDDAGYSGEDPNAAPAAASRPARTPLEKRLVWLTVAIGVLTLAAAVFVVWSVLKVQSQPQTPLERELAVFEAAVAKNPESAEAHLDYGAALYESGREEEGLKQLQLALKIKKNLYPALFNIAVIHWDQGKRDQAVKELEDLAARLPGTVDTWFRLGSYQQELKRWDDAIVSYEKVLGLTEGDVAARYRMAVCLEALGETDKAIEQYKSCLNYVPDYEPAVEALERLGTK